MQNELKSPSAGAVPKVHVEEGAKLIEVKTVEANQPHLGMHS